MGDEEAWAELADLYSHLGLLRQAAFCCEEVILLNPQSFVNHLRVRGAPSLPPAPARADLALSPSPPLKPPPPTSYPARDRPQMSFSAALRRCESSRCP